MKTKQVIFTSLFLFLGFTLSAQLKVRSDGSTHIGYAGYHNVWLGSYESYGVNNGHYSIESWGSCLNIWKPSPSPYNNISRDYYLFINVDGGVGIGKAPSNSGIVLDVSGPVYATSFNVSSDKRLKNDITPLANKTGLIYNLNGKSYKKQIQSERMKMPEQLDKNGNPHIEKTNENAKADSREFKEFGFIAQEFKEVYPELVSQDSLGYYSINYTGLIPLLVEALKEQKQQIENLTIKLNEGSSPVYQKSNAETQPDIQTTPALRQNTPNPYINQTSIGYYLPGSVQVADIYIYDMNGKQLKNVSLSQRGESSITILERELNAGMYMYALIADGRVIDTKHMILTK